MGAAACGVPVASGAARLAESVTVYVANCNSDTVTRDQGRLPGGKTAYVANIDSETVTPISTATNRPGKPIKVGHGPDGIAIIPDGKAAYVANYYSGTGTPILIGYQHHRAADRGRPWAGTIAITP